MEILAGIITKPVVIKKTLTIVRNTCQNGIEILNDEIAGVMKLFKSVIMKVLDMIPTKVAIV
ncbi:MAG: hypothetical protein GX468_03305, partial [Thermotogaceae bacterium]|nr:hypothetical protein [Thermotogaceae bacterium]